MQVAQMEEASPDLREMAQTAQNEPVMIRQDGRDFAVLVSADAYGEVRKANLAKLFAIVEIANAQAKAAGLTEEKLAELLAEEA